jgi:predicted dehydrogenase
MRIAIISFAHLHANSYAEVLKKIPDVEFVAIADEDRKRGEGKAEIYGTKYYQDYNEMLEKEKLDAVIITSANAHHKDATVAAAKRGVHILCEKPMATTLSDAKIMIDVCEENKVIYQQIFPMRYSPAVQNVKKKIEEGVIGKLLAIKGTNHGNMPDPEIYPFFTDRELSGGGAIMDHTVHVADLMRWITKSEVKEVYAEADRLIHNNIEVEDVAILSLEFENGLIATLDPSWSRPKSYPTWGDVTMDFIGEDGVIFLDAFAQNILVHSDKNMRSLFKFFGSNLDYLMIKDFLETVKNKSKPKVTGFDGLKSLEVAIAAYKSVETKSIVKLPLTF